MARLLGLSAAPMNTPEKLPPDSREEIVRRVSAYEGRRVIVRSRDFFWAQIDRVDCARGIAVEWTMLAVLADPPMMRLDYVAKMIGRRFSYAASWDIILPGRGRFFATYASWGIIYDEGLNDEIEERFQLMGPHGDFGAWAEGRIAAWERVNRG